MAEHYSKLPKDQVNCLVPPLLQANLCAVHLVKQDRTGQVTLVYSDGTTESIHIDRDIREFNNFFELVGMVQDARSPGGPQCPS